MILLDNRVVLVSGSSRGIGYAICRKFASEGAIVYAGVRNDADFDKVSWKSEETNGEIIPIKLDVCDIDSIKSVIMAIKKQQGRLDVLVNNAGITIIERFDMVTDNSIKKVYDTNVFGLMHLTQFAIRLLKKSEKPTIINMSSIEAAESDIGQTVYASSKSAVESMTRTWTKEYASSGFRVNAIAPGNVNTDMFNIVSDENRAEMISKIGMGRVAEAEEIANVALFLASDLASYITGEVIEISGGLVM